MSILMNRRKLIKKLLEKKFNEDKVGYPTAKDVLDEFNNVMEKSDDDSSIADLVQVINDENGKENASYSVNERTILRDLDIICPKKLNNMGYLPKEIYESYHFKMILKEVINEATLGKPIPLNNHTWLVPFSDKNRAQIVLEKSLDALENIVLDGIVMEKNIYFVFNTNIKSKKIITEYFD